MLDVRLAVHNQKPTSDLRPDADLSTQSSLNWRQASTAFNVLKPEHPFTIQDSKSAAFSSRDAGERKLIETLTNGSVLVSNSGA